MAWSHIGTNNDAGLGSATPTLPGASADDVIFLSGKSAGAMTATGYTLIRETLGEGSDRHATFYRVAIGGEGNPTLSGSGGTRAIVSVYRSGGTPSLDVESGQANALQSATTAPGVTVTNDGSLALHTSFNAAGGSHTPPSGFTEPANGDSVELSLAYDLSVPSGATGDVSGTLSSPDENVAHLAVFATTGGGGGGGSDKPRRGLLLPL